MVKRATALVALIGVVLPTSVDCARRSGSASLHNGLDVPLVVVELGRDWSVEPGDVTGLELAPGACGEPSIVVRTPDGMRSARLSEVCDGDEILIEDDDLSVTPATVAVVNATGVAFDLAWPFGDDLPVAPGATVSVPLLESAGGCIREVLVARWPSGPEAAEGELCDGETWIVSRDDFLPTGSMPPRPQNPATATITNATDEDASITVDGSKEATLPPGGADEVSLWHEHGVCSYVEVDVQLGDRAPLWVAARLCDGAVLTVHDEGIVVESSGAG